MSIIDGGHPGACFKLLLEGLYENAERSEQSVDPAILADQAYAVLAAREPERTAPNEIQELALEYLRSLAWEVCAPN